MSVVPYILSVNSQVKKANAGVEGEGGDKGKRPPRGQEKASVLHLSDLCLSPALREKLSNRPADTVIVRIEHRVVEIRLIAVIAHRSRAVESACHGEAAGMRTVLDLETVVEAATGVVRADGVTHIEQLMLSPSLAIVSGSHHA